MTFLNPQILEYSKETCEAWEGCISNDDEICLIKRPKRVKVQFYNIQGKNCDLICDGLVSRIFQHEIDHLDGKTMEE